MRDARDVSTLASDSREWASSLPPARAINSKDLADALSAVLNLPERARRIEIVLEVDQPVVIKCESLDVRGTERFASVFQEFVLVPKP